MVCGTPLGADEPLTRSDLGVLAAFAPALLFATAPRLDLVIAGSLFYLGLALLRPALSLGVVAATLPFYRLPLDGPGPSPGLAETALLLTALGIGGRWGLDHLRGAGPAVVRPQPTLFDWPVALLLAAGLASLLVTEYLHLSLRELRVLVLEPVTYFYLLAAVLRQASDLRRVLEAFLVAALGVALLGVVQSGLGLGAAEAQGVRRASAFFGSPNHLGLHLGRAFPFLVAGLLWYQGRRRWAYASAALGVGAGLVATFSLGAWLGVAAALLALAWLYGLSFPQRRRALLGAVAAAALVLGVAAIPLGQIERVASHLSPSEGTTFFRLHLWSASVAMVRDHPFFGVGMDNFLYLYQQRYLTEAAASDPNLSHPHNLALHYWLQLGLLGLASAVWLLGSFFSHGLRCFRKADSPEALALTGGAMASMVDFLVHGLVDNSYFLPDLAYIFWLTLAAAQLCSPKPAGEWPTGYRTSASPSPR